MQRSCGPCSSANPRSLVLWSALTAHMSESLLRDFSRIFLLGVVVSQSFGVKPARPVPPGTLCRAVAEGSVSLMPSLLPRSPVGPRSANRLNPSFRRPCDGLMVATVVVTQELTSVLVSIMNCNGPGWRRPGYNPRDTRAAGVRPGLLSRRQWNQDNTNRRPCRGFYASIPLFRRAIREQADLPRARDSLAT